MNTFVSGLRCTECEAVHEAGVLQTVCRECGRPLRVDYDLEAARQYSSRTEVSRRRPSLWKYLEVLTLDWSIEPVSLGEGGTPLLRAPRLAQKVGLEQLYIKDESLNPTGSFKARGMSVAVSMARELGAGELAVPSAGNAGGALAAYAARAGLKAHIAMPEDVPEPNRIEAELCGATVTTLAGTIADCGKFIGQAARAHGWFDLSTLKEPYRVEGKKTMGYELAEQLDWELPDVILYPTGGGTGLVGMQKAFEEMRTLGWIAPRSQPRWVAVQAEGCSPIVRGFEAGQSDAMVPENPATFAGGLRVPSPIGDRWILKTIRESGGTAISVSDRDLRAQTAEIAATEGLYFAPEEGALASALEVLVESGWIRPSERVVLIATGSGHKYPDPRQEPIRS